MKCLFEDVDGGKAQVDYRWRRLDLAIPQTADQIFDPMRDSAKAPQAHLRCRTLYRVDGAEQAVDLIWMVIAF